MGREERYGRIVIDRSDESSKLEKSSRIKSVKEVKLSSSRKFERSCKALAFTFHSRKGSALWKELSSSIFMVRVRVTRITQPYEAFSHGGEFV